MDTTKENKYSWDDLYAAAEDKPCGDVALNAKDLARYEVECFAIDHGLENPEEAEIPEEAVESLCDRYNIMFDEDGNIVEHDFPERYFEISLGNKEDALFDTADYEQQKTICIISDHYPDIAEASNFLKAEIGVLGCNAIYSITELTKKEYKEYRKYFDIEKDELLLDYIGLIENKALAYETGRMMRDDSEIEIDVADDGSIWLCDYSPSRGGAEFVENICSSDNINMEKLAGLCDRHGWASVGVFVGVSHPEKEMDR